MDFRLYFHKKSSNFERFLASVTRLGNLAPIGRQFNLTGAFFSYFYLKKRPKMSKFLDFSQLWAPNWAIFKVDWAFFCSDGLVTLFFGKHFLV